MMEATFYHLPQNCDSERLRPYISRQPTPTPPHFPQVRISSFRTWNFFNPLLAFSLADSTSTFGHDRILSAVVYGDAVLCVLLHGGHEGAVFGCQGAQKAELEISHQVHDVVPAPRGAQNHQRGI